jgi:hypothetical protein
LHNKRIKNIKDEQRKDLTGNETQYGVGPDYGPEKGHLMFEETVCQKRVYHPAGIGNLIPLLF